MGNWLLSILSDPNTRWILLGCLLLGFSSGIIGSFTFLRRQSLMGIHLLTRHCLESVLHLC